MPEIIASLALVMLFGVLSYMMYKQWEVRYKGGNFYLRNVVAYRVGLIRQKSEKNGITMVFQPLNDSFIDEIEADVEKDVNKLGTLPE